MSIRSLIILSQINPPAVHSRVLERDRIIQCLEQSVKYPLTIVQAGTGYGKSTAILSFLRNQNTPVYWFTTSGSDRDPKLFLAKLFTAFNQGGILLGDEALRVLSMPDATQLEALIALLNEVTKKLSDDTLLILDDFHRVSDVPEIINFINWIINQLPPQLHLVIVTRHRPDFPSMNKWVVKGNVIEIDTQTLAFSSDEIRQLFEESYGISLSEKDIALLQNKTGGWAIGLQIIWQTLQSHPGMSIHQVLEDSSQSRSALFEYLAEEVLAGLQPETKHFLLTTSILSKLDSETCDFLLNTNNSDELLRHLHKMELFIEELRPGVWRYHQIFREFLNNQLQNSSINILELHLKIASYFRAHEYWEETIYHLLSAKEFDQINQILETIGDPMIKDGRYESINYWISEIPEYIRDKYPKMIYLLGEVNRFMENFEEALEYYHQAEREYRIQKNKIGISLALKGQGQVFLDTIRPINADQILQDALKLLDPADTPQDYADLLVLIAENQLNLGYPDSAENLLNEAKKLRSELDMDTDLIQARIYLRTGRLQEGINLLKQREANNPKLSPLRPQRFHRESTLLLSLFYAIVGDIDKAEKYAFQGIKIGKILQSTFVQSVGFMRLGHAFLLRSQGPFSIKGFDIAMRYFQKSMDNIEVTRIHVEPLWGMCRALGYTGQIQEAEKVALDSLAIAKEAGDEWISVLIQLSLGAGAVLAHKYDMAQKYLTTAEVIANKVKDPFSLCVSRLWLSIKAWQQGFRNTSFGYLERILPILIENNYCFLLKQETLIGLKDPENIYPLLLAAYEKNIQSEKIITLLENRNIEPGIFHPGYTLWVKTFGGFQIWCGDKFIDRKSWKREKAQQLMQLFIANRDKWLHRDQINAILWADTPVENANNYLKVVFNSLNQVLEPDRPRGAHSFFVERKQESYRLNPKARIIIDTDLFLEAVDQGSASSLDTAINLYNGRYFSDCFIQEWLMIEDQYYHQQFLLAAEKLITMLMNEKQYEKALEISYGVIGLDNLWESAYRFQMKIFHVMGQPSMVGKVFRKCQDVFSEQLNMSVSDQTIALYKKFSS